MLAASDRVGGCIPRFAPLGGGAAAQSPFYLLPFSATTTAFMYGWKVHTYA